MRMTHPRRHWAAKPSGQPAEEGGGILDTDHNPAYAPSGSPRERHGISPRESRLAANIGLTERPEEDLN